MPLPVDGPPFPESTFVVAETFVRFDHGAGIAEVLAGDPDDVAERLDRPLVLDDDPTEGVPGAVLRSPSQERYEEMVVRCQEHIRAGDAYQIVPSQRAERSTSASPLALYRALRRVNPSPYLFLLELGELALVGSSPSDWSRAGTVAPAYVRSREPRAREKATSSACSRRRRIARST